MSNNQKNNIDALKILANEIISTCNQIINKNNYLVIKTGKVIQKNNSIYIVEIENTQYEIKSQLNFNINDIVDVLTNKKMTGKKYLLG